MCAMTTTPTGLPPQYATPAPFVRPQDLMSSDEVAEAFGVRRSSLTVALGRSGAYDKLAYRLPAPIRRIGRIAVWSRRDVEEALARTEPFDTIVADREVNYGN